jgi:hypothetical protein
MDNDKSNIYSNFCINSLADNWDIVNDKIKFFNNYNDLRKI